MEFYVEFNGLKSQSWNVKHAYQTNYYSDLNLKNNVSHQATFSLVLLCSHLWTKKHLQHTYCKLWYIWNFFFICTLLLNHAYSSENLKNLGHLDQKSWKSALKTWLVSGIRNKLKNCIRKTLTNINRDLYRFIIKVIISKFVCIRRERTDRNWRKL